MKETIFQENYDGYVSQPEVVYTEQSNSVVWYS